MPIGSYILAVLAFIGLATGPCRAAEFSIVNQGNGWDSSTNQLICNVRMTGELQGGDARKLATALKSIQSLSKTLCLDSPGGSYDEAVSIATLLIKERIGTKVEQYRKCFSACSIIFMSGVMATGAEMWASPAREIHATAELGFHAPYLTKSSIPSGTYDSASIVAAYQTAIKGLRKLMLLNSQDAWIMGELIPAELILEMLDRGPNELFLVDSVGRAVKYKIDVVGVRAVPRVSEAALCNACLNLFDQSPDTTLCKQPAKRDENRSISFSFGDEFGECRLAPNEDNGKTVWHVEAGPVASKPRDWAGRDRTTIPNWWMFPPQTRLKDIAGQ